MSDRKLLWKKLGIYNVFVVGTIEEDGFVYFPTPYLELLETYAKVADVKLPTGDASADWFDGYTDLPVEY